MKKAIFISGLVSANMLLLGALMKVLHLSGAGVMLTFSILLFSFGFLPFALVSSYKNQEKRMYKWLYIVTFLVFGIDLVGALFKILHWPGSGILMLVGIPLPFLVFLPVYLYQTSKNKEKSVQNNLGVMFGLTFLAVFSVFLALNISANILDCFALNSFNNENSAKYYQTINKTSESKDIIKQKSNELCAFIDDLKYEILVANGNNQFSNNKLDNYSPISTINRSGNNISIFASKGSNQSKIDILKNMIGEYGELVSKSDKVNIELKQLSNVLFDVSKKEVVNNSNVIQVIEWDEHEFPTANLIIVLDVLSRIQSNVRFVETEYLSSL